MFWKVLVFEKRKYTPTFLKRILHRSQGVSLDLMIKRDDLAQVYDVIRSIPAEAKRRVKTLYVDNFSDSLPLLPFSKVLSSFPSLENICSTNPVEPMFNTSRIRPRLKMMQIYINSIGNFAIPGCFPELCWLKLTCEDSALVLQALPNLPNLQVLHLSTGGQNWIINEDMNRINLPELRVLISIDTQILQQIHAPKLSYYTNIIGHSTHPTIDGEPYGFDLSKIIQLEIATDSSKLSYIGGTDQYDASGDIQRSSLRTSLMTSFAVDTIFHQIPTSYPYLFFLFFSDLAQTQPSAFITALVCLKKAVNLVQVTLSLERVAVSFEADMRALLDCLRGSTTMRHLIILSGSSFRTICHLLSDGDFCPCLKKLSFSFDHFEGAEDETICITDSLRILMAGRSATCLKPLEEIELRRFWPLPSNEIDEIKRLGLRIIQKEMWFNHGNPSASTIVVSNSEV